MTRLVEHRGLGDRPEPFPGRRADRRVRHVEAAEHDHVGAGDLGRDRLADELRALPGVRSVGFTNSVPLGFNNSDRGVDIPTLD